MTSTARRVTIGLTRGWVLYDVAMGMALRLVIAVMVFGCASREPFPCATSDQCISGGTQGVCEPAGFCSFPDTACPGGRRYEPNAGGGLAGTCIESDAGVASCGGLGAACCETGPACGGNTFCDAQMCRQCVTDVGFGRRFSCAVKHDGTVWCAGENEQGQLGSGNVGVPSATPVQARDGAASPIMDAIAVAAGREHACAIRGNGTVWCWGDNGNGQLGDGSTNLSPIAVQVRMANDAPLTGIVELDAGDRHTCARDGAGGVWCWGANGDGELGDGTTTERTQAVPVVVAVNGAPLAGAIELASGGFHNCIRQTGGALLCWGRNTKGTVGDTTIINKPVPVQVLPDATTVAAGRYHTCATKADTTVWCWGEPIHGRLGTGDTGFAGEPVLQPTQTTRTGPGGPPFVGVAGVAAGASTCAITMDRGVSCWGDDHYGQTGVGGSPFPTPVTVDDAPLTGIDRLVSHWTRTCAFATDGRLLCWGRNSEGELGDETFMNRGRPTPLRLSCP